MQLRDLIPDYFLGATDFIVDEAGENIYFDVEGERQVHCDVKPKMDIPDSVLSVAGIVVIGLIIVECRNLYTNCMEEKCRMIFRDKIQSSIIKSAIRT